MSNRFRSYFSKERKDISPEEIASFLKTNNADVSHSVEWETKTADSPSKKERMIARRANIRTAHASDYEKEGDK